MNVASVFVSPAAEADRYLPEGPHAVTVAGRSAVAWVNIQTAADATSGAIHLRFWDTGEVRALPQPGRPGFIVPTDRPGVVLAGEDKQLGTVDLTTGVFTALATLPDDNPRTMINDGNVMPGGQAVVFGTKDFQFKDPIAHLYLFTPDDRRVTTLAGNQTCSNGKVFGRDAAGLLLYDIDTPRRVVTRYRLDLDKRTLREEGVAVDLRDEEGFPDGMVDGGDGSVIVAFYNPRPVADGRAVRFRLSDGEPLETWTTPGSPQVTCPLLVERDGGVKLILTTAVEGMPAELRRQCPHAGDLFLAATTLPRLPTADLLRL
jgi:sugar lactone lactonase YvrE